MDSNSFWNVLLTTHQSSELLNFPSLVREILCTKLTGNISLFTDRILGLQCACAYNALTVLGRTGSNIFIASPNFSSRKMAMNYVRINHFIIFYRCVILLNLFSLTSLISPHCQVSAK